MSGITTHVLDTSRGCPAAGVPITLELHGPREEWQPIGRGVTDDDGRLRTLIDSSAPLVSGTYRLTFDTRRILRRVEDPIVLSEDRRDIRRRQRSAALPRTAATQPVWLQYLSRELSALWPSYFFEIRSC